MESMDIVAQNVENIGNLFPDCITEARDENGKIQKVVDRDRLMQKFSHKINSLPQPYSVEDREFFSYLT